MELDSSRSIHRVSNLLSQALLSKLKCNNNSNRLLSKMLLQGILKEILLLQAEEPGKQMLQE